jgi:hypothetical protein
MEQTLFLGNGLNRMNNSEYSWEEVIVRISKKLDIELTKDFKNVPFPLLLEQMVFRTQNTHREGILKIKDVVAKELLLLKGSFLHENLKLLNIKNFLTTNYDYLIEKSLIDLFVREDYGSVTREQLHSIKRVIQIGDYKIWHAHGEINDFKNGSEKGRWRPHTILIGYEQYASYLREIQSYLKGKIYGTEIKSSSKKPSEQNFSRESWIDCFFLDNLIFIGTSLDFSEIDLWWLLTFRVIIKKDQKQHIISNKIILISPCFERGVSKAKNDLLRSLDVEIVTIHSEDYESFYKKAFKKIMNGELDV